MSYPRIVSRVFNSLWAIEHSYLETILSILHQRQTSEFAGVSKDDFVKGERRDESADDAATRVIFASGVVGKHLSSMEEISAGGLSLDRLQNSLTEAEHDPSVKNIVLWLDTPGGVIHGVPETAAQIRRISAKKTVVGFTDSMAASAGYWLLAATEYVYATPSADLGSIGVYSALLDYTGWMEKKGLKMELFKAGDLKAAGMPGVPLTDAQREHIQASVDDAYAMFTGDIVGFRGAGVKKETMQGQVFRGKHAAGAGLADEIVTSLAEVLEDLARIS